MADWTAISGYTPQDYTDTAIFQVDSDTKKIALITGQPLVAGEENSQYMRFILDRYWDGIDIKDKAFYVEFSLAGTYYGKTAAVNAEYTTEQIRFGWVVPKEACCISGTLMFILRIESEDYVLKTQIAEHPVFKSVNVESVVPEPTREAWYRNFEARVENAISAAQAVQAATEIAAQNAQTAEANAEAAAAEVTQKSISIATVNVAGMVGGELTSENIADAIGLALAQCSYIYIPAGEYSFNVEITDDCTIFMDEQCFISSETADPIIHARNCSINLIGGNILNGEDDDSRVALANRNGLVYFESCHDSSIVGVKSPYSKANGVIWIKDCENFVLERSTFDRMLRAAMFVCGHCVNVAVRNCKFTNSMPLSGQDYCYFVYTGSMLLTDNFEPVDGLIYENNYCSGSEDCGLDTHGARNVIIRNNIVLDTVCAITAYNDNKRVTRPAGWKMENILIENNYCDSTRQNAQGRSYPHPFLFIGASNNETALYDEFRNCIVRNNTFRTANNFEYGAIFNNVVSRNLIYECNTFKFYDGAVAPITFRSSFGSAFRNNRLEDGSATVYFKHFLGEVSGNVGFTYNWDDDFVSYVKGLDNIFPQIIAPTYRAGDIFWSNGMKICSSYGICARYQYASAIKTFSITVNDGIATVANNVYIPHLGLTLTGGGSAYIKDVIDATHFIIVNGSQNPIADGTYTATIKDVTMFSLT